MIFNQINLNKGNVNNMLSISCDHCKKDITTRGSMPAYRLFLGQENIPNTSSIEYSVCVYPPLKHTAYFCSIECLFNWLKTEYKL